MQKSYLVPINRAGWPFIAIFAAISVALGIWYEPLGWVGLLATLWCTYFFRDPDRIVPVRDGLIVSPADGFVQSVASAVPPIELGMADTPYNRVSIFMDVFDVHVNRIPAAGRVVKTSYRPGRFFNAALDKASEHNERQSIRIATTAGEEIAVVQIAGLVARRIKCDLSEGEEVVTGRRFGMIRFGSRLDVYVPADKPILVIEGQHAYAGETVLADLRSEESSRTGEVR